MQIEFYKYQGTGNDFVIIDDRSNEIKLSTQQINFLCDRNFGIGADGLMLLQNHNQLDFAMKYYNADGNESSMCGNGGRCLTQFAFDIANKKNHYNFIAIDGKHEAIINNQIIELKMNDVVEINAYENAFILNTGSPHFVVEVDDIDKINVAQKGAEIRYSKVFKENGINVNFVKKLSNNKLFVRTYERGVENETKSCGTGVVASTLALSNKKKGNNVVDIETLGGNLQVKFSYEKPNFYNNIWLCGKASFVFKGMIEI